MLSNSSISLVGDSIAAGSHWGRGGESWGRPLPGSSPGPARDPQPRARHFLSGPASPHPGRAWSCLGSRATLAPGAPGRQQRKPAAVPGHRPGRGCEGRSCSRGKRFGLFYPPKQSHGNASCGSRRIWKRKGEGGRGAEKRGEGAESPGAGAGGEVGPRSSPPPGSPAAPSHRFSVFSHLPAALLTGEKTDKWAKSSVGALGRRLGWHRGLQGTRSPATERARLPASARIPAGGPGHPPGHTGRAQPRRGPAEALPAASLPEVLRLPASKGANIPTGLRVSEDEAHTPLRRSLLVLDGRLLASGEEFGLHRAATHCWFFNLSPWL